MSRFSFYKDGAGYHRWRLQDGNYRTIADSAEGYTSEQGCRDGAATFKRLAPTAPIASTQGAANPGWEIYLATNGQYYWRFQSGNGRIVADGAEGYVSRDGAERAVTNVKGELGRATL